MLAQSFCEKDDQNKSNSRYNASSSCSKPQKVEDKSVPESFRKSLEIGSDLDHMTQTSIAESKGEDVQDSYTQAELLAMPYSKRLRIENELE